MLRFSWCIESKHLIIQVDRMQDVFQFGIVVFFCLFGILPWQRADATTDPNFAHFCAWRNKKTGKPPKSFKPLTSRAQKMFRKLMDVDPSKRLLLTELGNRTENPFENIPWILFAHLHLTVTVHEFNQLRPTGKFTEDRWLKKTGGRSVVGDALGAVGIGSGGDLLNARGGGGSMININGKCEVTKMRIHNIQRSSQVDSPGLVSFAPALAYHFSLNLPGASTLADVIVVENCLERPNNTISIRNFKGRNSLTN